MAVNLKLKKKCNIVPPRWLNLSTCVDNNCAITINYRQDSPEYLQDKLSEETNQPVFSDLPFRYAEISKVLLDMCVVGIFEA